MKRYSMGLTMMVETTGGNWCSFGDAIKLEEKLSRVERLLARWDKEKRWDRDQPLRESRERRELREALAGIQEAQT